MISMSWEFTHEPMTLNMLGNRKILPNCVLNTTVSQRWCISKPHCCQYFCKDCPGTKLLSDTTTNHTVGMTDLKKKNKTNKKRDEGRSKFDFFTEVEAG